MQHLQTLGLITLPALRAGRPRGAATAIGHTAQGAHGFSGLVKRLLAGESLHLHHLERYQHRISAEGKPLYYYAAIGRKLAPWPATV